MSKKMMILLFAVIICLSLAETKIPLSKEELRKIDWYGENAGQHRNNGFTKIFMKFMVQKRPKPLQYR